jgi:hypothetical protein
MALDKVESPTLSNRLFLSLSKQLVGHFFNTKKAGRKASGI